MKKMIDTLLHGSIAACLCASCATVLAVPKAAEQEDDAVTFADAEAPPKRTPKAASMPPAVKPSPSPSVAKEVPTGKPGKAVISSPSAEKHAKARPAADSRRPRTSNEAKVMAPKKARAPQKTTPRKK